MIDQPHLPKNRPSSRMPVDKQQNGKPFTPSLSSNFRSAKSPLTPRLAGSGPNTPSSGQRREGFVRARSPGKDEPPTPLAVNITPRSAARRSRIGTESPSTTPTSRPAVASPATQNTGTPHGLGLASPLARVGTSLSEVSSSVQSPTPVYTGPRRVSGAKSMLQEEDSRFFRADDARPLPQQQLPKASPDPESQFFYLGSTSNIEAPKVSPVKTVHPPSVDDKFFHASEARPQQQRPARPELQTRKTVAPVVSTRSQQTSQQAAFIRSPSPGKTTQSRPISRGKDAPARPRSGVFAIPSPNERRGSMGSSVSGVKDAQPTHKKSMSANSVTSTPKRKLSGPRPITIPTLEERLGLNVSTNSTESLPIPTASPGSLSPRSISLGSQASSLSLPATRVNTSTDPSTNPSSTTTSTAPDPKPSTSISSTLPPTSPPLAPTTTTSDPATQARRERKVLDLEISNSSLLAINKTLERELRKQNVELRRFRRLSRSGRLSFAPNGLRTVSDSTLGTLAELDSDDDVNNSASDDSASNSDDNDNDDENENENDDLLSSTSPSSSTNGISTARARQRRRDEKRLMLDLSKHQQLLLDSQKLSQSIRRCLTCTEELIKEGGRALAYTVEVGSLRVGGRVLRVDDEGGPGTNGGGTPGEVEEGSGSDEIGVGVDGALGFAGGGAGEARRGLLSPGREIGDWLQGGLWVSQSPTQNQELASSESPQSLPDRDQNHVEVAGRL